MIRRPPRSTHCISSAASDVYKRQDDEERRDLLNFDPQDATVEIWSGQGADVAAMIASSLRENHIPYRPDPDTAEPKSGPDEMRPTRILVFPDDAKRAKAIVREIVDAIPPE